MGQQEPLAVAVEVPLVEGEGELLVEVLEGTLETAQRLRGLPSVSRSAS
ncbi:hypothetical protein GA0115254_110624 [Streptomyces sp. Ncost-T10-10d]|nr:hypothetical protein GA0115254_110624 [Streptomyces sp. Ncost-T10-10d]